MNRLKKVGQFLRLIRTEAGLTAPQLSQAIGKEPTYIAYLEDYPEEISLVDFLDIAKTLGLDETKTLQRLYNFVQEGEPS